MNVKTLNLTDVRAIHTAELHFQPGFNVIAGVNGVGKTTILDALAICCSAVARHTNRLRKFGTYFENDDIRLGASALQAECEFACRSAEFSFAVHRSRDVRPAREMKEWSRENSTKGDNSALEVLHGEVPTGGTGGVPNSDVLAVLFSTGRSLATKRTPRPESAAGTVSAAFARAFSHRQLELGEFAAWMRAQYALVSERPRAQRTLKALSDAVYRFLPDYHNLRPEDDDSGQSLLIEHDGQSLKLHQLSDGERGILALVFDLTRRLAQANPELADPAAEAEAVVLIDELELHLHPTWQRQIVRNLSETFPRCQFIATTHSPQVIGEVEPDRIHIMSNGDVYSPRHSFGVDSSRVLEEVMDTNARNAKIQELLQDISNRVGEDRFGEARSLLMQLAARVGEGDPEVTRVRTLLEFLEDE